MVTVWMGQTDLWFKSYKERDYILKTITKNSVYFKVTYSFTVFNLKKWRDEFFLKSSFLLILVVGIRYIVVTRLKS